MKVTKKILAFLMVAVMAFSACITVSAAEKATSLKLNAATIKWIPGKSGSFKATVTPAGASKTFKWTSSNPKVATVTTAGKLTAKAIGTTTITCATTDGSNLKATCKVTVGKAVTSVKLNAATIKWPVGKSGSFKTTVAPADAINKTLTWTSSNTKVATISSTGKLTSVGAGTATITCKAKDGSGKYATCKVTVTGASNLATSLKLNCKTLNWPIGKAGSFKATITPATASKTLKWTSSNTKVATISSAGKITAVGAGKTTITCATTDGSNLKATCAVTVWTPVSSVKLNAATINWPVGKSASFKATVLPENAKNKTLEWTSSDESVATVSSTGKLTAVGAGTATITCKATDGSGKFATCFVTVKPKEDVNVPVASVKLNAATITWIPGKSGSFKATVSPADATNKTLEWTSSNPEVATVSSTGKLTAVSIGTTTITCKSVADNTKFATCTVRVVEPVKSVSFELNSIKVFKGKTATLYPIIEPQNAYNKNLTWTSSNTAVATVSANGVVTAKASGTATITCTTKDGTNLKASCTVTVGSKLTGLKLNAGSLTWEKGKAGRFTPVLTPADAITTLSWKSLNPTVATIDGTGKIVTKQAGTAIIVCQSADGTNLKAYCRVLVTDSSKPSTRYNEYFKNYFRDGAYTVSGETTMNVSGVDFEADVSYGINQTTTNIRVDLSLSIRDFLENFGGIGDIGDIGDIPEELENLLNTPMAVSMLTRTDGMYILFPFVNQYSKISGGDVTTLKAFSNLIYEGSSTKKVSGVNYRVERFTPYGAEGMFIEFYFNSAGTLKYINQIKPDGSSLFISNVKISGTYTANNYVIPSGYTEIDE